MDEGDSVVVCVCVCVPLATTYLVYILCLFVVKFQSTHCMPFIKQVLTFANLYVNVSSNEI